MPPSAAALKCPASTYSTIQTTRQMPALPVLTTWVFGTFGSVLPRSGDQDLFLHLFGATGPVVSASALPLTLLDAVSFALPPPFPFVPVFQIFGFTTGVCGNFTTFDA